MFSITVNTKLLACKGCLIAYSKSEILQTLLQYSTVCSKGVFEWKYNILNCQCMYKSIWQFHQEKKINVIALYLKFTVLHTKKQANFSVNFHKILPLQAAIVCHNFKIIHIFLQVRNFCKYDFCKYTSIQAQKIHCIFFYWTVKNSCTDSSFKFASSKFHLTTLDFFLRLGRNIW